MRKQHHSMACYAMVLLYLSVCMGSTGCGAIVYEQVATAESFAEEAETLRDGDVPESKAEVLSLPDVAVYVCGAVQKSGVYELPAGARVADAIEAAGGLMADADETAVNQAGYVTDGQQITVPTKAEVAAGLYESSSSKDGERKVNINTADLAELTTLKGIGEARASDIIAYREAHGPFGTIEEIMQVSGIKTSLFEKIRDRITVG